MTACGGMTPAFLVQKLSLPGSLLPHGSEFKSPLPSQPGCRSYHAELHAGLEQLKPFWFSPACQASTPAPGSFALRAQQLAYFDMGKSTRVFSNEAQHFERTVRPKETADVRLHAPPCRGSAKLSLFHADIAAGTFGCSVFSQLSQQEGTPAVLCKRIHGPGEASAGKAGLFLLCAF